MAGCDKNATWCSPSAFCAQRGWSLRRLLHEVRQRTVLCREIPDGVVKIDWQDPDSERLLKYLTAGEASMVHGVRTRDLGSLFVLGLDRETVAVEVMDAPTDGEVPALPVKRWRKKPSSPDLETAA